MGLKIVEFTQNVQYVRHSHCPVWAPKREYSWKQPDDLIVIKLSAMYPLDKLQKDTSLPNRIYYFDVCKERANKHKIYAILTQKSSCKQKSNIPVAWKKA
jgi:hypothetical protein